MHKLHSPCGFIRFNIIRPFLICITTVVLFFNSGCGDGIVDAEPGRRDYIWSFDTLDISGAQNVEPACIWGPSANDVWAAGASNEKTLLWHYNGTTWEKEFINAGYPVQLWGTSRDNIWLITSGPGIWKYNGSEWSLLADIAPPEGFNHVTFYSMYGNSADDIFVVGAAAKEQFGAGPYKGVILHYKNGKWSYMNIPEKHIILLYIYKQKSTGNYFIYGYYSESDGIKTKTFKYDGKNSLTEVSDGHGLAEVNGEVYFLDNQKIYTYNYNRLVLKKNFTGTSYMGGMTGRSENDFFCYDRYFNVLHYNGTDFKNIEENMMWLDGYVFEKDVFLLVKGSGPVVLHGELR
jgi:hypothetical protein